MRRHHLLTGTMLSAIPLLFPAVMHVSHAQAQAEMDPVVTAPPNAPDQSPALPDQTRAPQPADPVAASHEVVADDLPQLWAMEFLPDGRMLVTATRGSLHIIAEDGSLGPEIARVPDVDTSGQGGLLDVALASDYETSGRIFLSYSEPRDDGNGTTVASAVLNAEEDGGTLEDVTVIFRQTPSYDGRLHFGSRIVPADDGTLYVTVGERSDEEVRGQAQDLDSGLGKVFRLTETGEPSEDNPFLEQADAQPEIWSYGHRNVQSAALDADGRLWTVEHGARGGDELNRPEAGGNYGWPEVAYGVEYSGDPIGAGVTESVPTEQPTYYWDPVIAPSGMALYEGDEFPEWEGAFLIGGLVSQGIVVVHLDDDNRVSHEERIPLDARVRDVRVGPDGAVYAVTEDRDAGTSEILRVTQAS